MTWSPGGTLAAATETVVLLFATDSWRLLRTLALPGVGVIVNDATRDRWLFIDSQNAVHLDDAGKTERLTSTVNRATAYLTTAGDVLLSEPSYELNSRQGRTTVSPRLRRFTRDESGWIEHRVALTEGESIDPSGRIAVTLWGDRAQLRRLSDGEVLHFDGAFAWTDRLAHDGHPDKARAPWRLRKGDAVNGKLVEGAAAAAVAPRVPDLWTQFWSGRPLPGL